MDVKVTIEMYGQWLRYRFEPGIPEPESVELTFTEKGHTLRLSTNQTTRDELKSRHPLVIDADIMDIYKDDIINSMVYVSWLIPFR